MSFNMTFVVQMIAFFIFAFICMQLWPLILDRIAKRQDEIKKSIESANRAVQEIELSKTKAEGIVSDAKRQALEIVDAANKRKDRIIDQAAVEAKEEKARIIQTAAAEIESEKNRAREELRKNISGLVVQCARKVMEQKIDEKADAALADEILKQI